MNHNHMLSFNKISWKYELLSILGRIREICGKIRNVETINDFYRKVKQINGCPTFTAYINCDGLISSNDIDAVDLTFLNEIPKELVPFYALVHNNMFNKVEKQNQAPSY